MVEMISLSYSFASFDKIEIILSEFVLSRPEVGSSRIKQTGSEIS